MSTISKSQRDFIAADLAAIEDLMKHLTPSDFVSRKSLEGRRDDLRRSLQSAKVPKEETRTLASATLFFGGTPVVRNRGIESEFGARAVGKFQELVSEVFASRRQDALGKAGPVSQKDLSRLHITNVVRGSFGFQLDQIDDDVPLFDSGLKESVDQAVKVIA